MIGEKKRLMPIPIKLSEVTGADDGKGVIKGAAGR